MLRKISDRTVHRMVYRSALFISSTNFRFIGMFNHIIRLQYKQEQSRQTLLPGLKMFYDPRAFKGGIFNANCPYGNTGRAMLAPTGAELLLRARVQNRILPLPPVGTAQSRFAEALNRFKKRRSRRSRAASGRGVPRAGRSSYNCSPACAYLCAIWCAGP